MQKKTGEPSLLFRLWQLAPLWVPLTSMILWTLFFGFRVVLTRDLMEHDYKVNITRNLTCSDPAIKDQFRRTCEETAFAVSMPLWRKAFWDVWEHSTVCGGKTCGETLFGDWTLFGVMTKLAFGVGLAYLLTSFLHIVNAAAGGFVSTLRQSKEEQIRRQFHLPSRRQESHRD
jgi:hypothetical protein